MSLGSDLRTARESAGMTLEDVAERTRIRRTVIAAIEADDFAPCGGDVYARGHIRTIARTVGIDSDPLVAEFDRLNAPQEITAAEVFEADVKRPPRQPRAQRKSADQRAAGDRTAADRTARDRIPRERPGPNWTAVMVAALIVVLAIGGVQFLRNRSGASPSAGSSHSTGPTTSPSPSPSASATGPTVIAQGTPTGVQVSLSVTTGKSWIAATNSSGTTIFTGLVDAGQTQTFTDSARVKLVIGNAGAVHLIVNGVDLGTPGGTGEVLHLSFGPGNPTAAG
jgi:cytoskeleton protein RodZ